MSIVSVNQVGERAFEDERGLGYVRIFHVHSDSVSEDRKDVLRASGVPNMNSRHPDDDSTRLTRKDADNAGESRLLWEVECEYRRREVGDTPSSEDSSDPWDQPAQISFGRGHQYTREVTRAYDTNDTFANPTKAIVNSAGQRMEPVGQEESGGLIRIARNEQLTDFGPGTIQFYKNTVNKNQIMVAGYTIGARMGRMKDITAERILVPDIAGSLSIGGDDFYWSVTYEIEIDERTYDRNVLDQGYYELVAGKPRKILDEDGELIVEPHPLNGSGLKATLGGTPSFLTFQTYFAEEWENLDLPPYEDSDR